MGGQGDFSPHFMDFGTGGLLFMVLASKEFGGCADGRGRIGVGPAWVIRSRFVRGCLIGTDFLAKFLDAPLIRLSLADGGIIAGALV